MIDRTKKDRRIKKTERQLLDGLVELMEEKSINDITVRELSDKVDINRSTFYLHYQDIYDMIEHIEANLLEEFRETIDSAHKQITSSGDISENQLRRLLTNIFNFLMDNKKVCRALLGPNGDIKFLSQVTDFISNRIEFLIRNYTKNQFSETDTELVKNFYVSGCLGLVQYCLRHEKVMEQTSSEHMVNLFMTIIENNAPITGGHIKNIK